MLEYENEMFLSALQEDGLTIAAKGLGLEQVFFNLVKVYSDPGNLVLVLGCSEQEEAWLVQRLALKGEKTLPRSVTAEVSTSERELVYLEGGVLFVTSRILVVDLLMERLPAHLVTGVVVWKAHRVIDSCQESFILRLYRQKNKKGFIKAFSGSPVSFTAGFCKVERVMKNLMVRHLHLWPRFQATVSDVLSANQPEVVEIHLEMTPQMQEVQTAVLDLITFTLSEVKRLNPHLATDELTVENCVSKSFHKLLQRELHPIWHQLSFKTRQLVGDLKTLRIVLTYLTQFDAITFFNFVATLKTAESVLNSGGWQNLDSAETLFLIAQKRVFPGGTQKDAKRSKKEQEGFERNPKWEEIGRIVEEIREEVRTAKAEGEKLMIVTKDERTAAQVRDYLAVGPEKLLGRMFNKCLGEKYGYLPGNFEETEAEAEGRVEGKGKGNCVKGKGGKGMSIKKGHSEPAATERGLAGDNPKITLHALESCETFDTMVVLEELQPRYIVLYDCDMGFVRQVEVHQAQRPGLHTRVYFLLYRGSVEEQAYLTTLRREKKAFECLIKEKATMVVPEDREAGEEREAGKASDSAVALANTRRGGGVQQVKVTPRVIVDMREFRSALPSLLHKRGIDIEPVTLEVGDYIITPEICLERKSLSDLIGSLQNGRLYTQATAMTRFYAKPMLLIEFEAEQSFSLQGKLTMSRDVKAGDLMARLQLLTLHFPKLRILWSPSPHATAELVEELKQGRDEPEASKAATLGVDIIDEYNVEKYNPQIKELVSKLPGMNSKNIYGLLNKGTSLAEVASCPCSSLEEMVGGQVAGLALHNALHTPINLPDPAEVARKKPSGKQPRFKTRK